MNITEVQVKIVNNSDERLKASCSITFDGEFVVRDVKVIDGANGLFVAMPSRKLADHCPRCSSKNHLRARFCNNCGAKLAENRIGRKGASRVQLHAEIAHPINSECRERIQSSVLEAYEAELERMGEEDEEYDALDEDDAGEDYGDARDSDARDSDDRDDAYDAREEARQGDDFLSELKNEAHRRSRRSSEPPRRDEREKAEVYAHSTRDAEAAMPEEDAADDDDEFGAGLL